LLKAFIDILICQNDQSKKISWVITATFGGAIRDILCDEIPLVFTKVIYVTACVAGAVTYLGFEAIGFSLVLKKGQGQKETRDFNNWWSFRRSR